MIFKKTEKMKQTHKLLFLKWCDWY